MGLSIAEGEFEQAKRDDLQMDLFDLMRGQKKRNVPEETYAQDCPMCNARGRLISRITISEQQEGQERTAKIELNCRRCKWHPVHPWHGVWREAGLGEHGYIEL